QNAPQAPELLPVRVAIRTTLADAYLALGQLGDAEAQYKSALSADKNHARAQAGELATEVYGAKDVTMEPAGVDAGVDVLLAGAGSPPSRPASTPRRATRSCSPRPPIRCARTRPCARSRSWRRSAATARRPCASRTRRSSATRPTRSPCSRRGACSGCRTTTR